VPPRIQARKTPQPAGTHDDKSSAAPTPFWARGRVLAAAALGIFVAYPTLSFADPGLRLAALDSRGTLLVFDPKSPAQVKEIRIEGVSEKLIGIDWRPSDRSIYGLTATSEIFRIDPTNGKATFVSALTQSFDGGARCGIDFNPQTDKLRLLSSEGQNFRVHPDLGATAIDRQLTYAAIDRNAGKRPAVTAVAYTHSFPGSETTLYLGIDAATDTLVRIDPPNDGIVWTIGELGVDFGDQGGFEIVGEAGEPDLAWAASGSQLFQINLTTGATTTAGRIGFGGADIWGLARASDGKPDS
jgi:Domain of unknown function (DUF4394)